MPVVVEENRGGETLSTTYALEDSSALSRLAAAARRRMLAAMLCQAWLSRDVQAPMPASGLPRKPPDLRTLVSARRPEEIWPRWTSDSVEAEHHHCAIWTLSTKDF